MNNNQKGCYAEYLFATTAIQNGLNVSMPLLDKSKYDCIVEKDGELFKFQIKFMGKDRYKHSGIMQINLKRTGARSYNVQDVDFFAIFHEQYNGFFIVPNHGQHTMKLNINGKYKENFNNFAIIHR